MDNRCSTLENTQRRRRLGLRQLFAAFRLPEPERPVDCNRKRTPNGTAVLEYGNHLPSSVRLNENGRLIADLTYRD